jgi:ABC-type sugar transport system ATPase subunit
VIDLADRVLVMRQGRIVASLEPQGLTQERLVGLIVGYEEGIAPDAGREGAASSASTKARRG